MNFTSDMGNIALIGGTGKIGNILLQELLEKGHRVNILARNPQKLKRGNENLRVIQGDARNKNSISELVKGCDVLINAIGQPAKEPPQFSQVTKNIIEVCQQDGPVRYIVIAGLGMTMPTDRRRLGTKLITAVMHLLFPAIMTDKKLEYALLHQSNLDWTIIRIPKFIITKHWFGVKVNETDCPSMSVASPDLVKFIIDQINDTRYIRKAPFVSN